MTYTYRFANLLSDSDVAELELTNVKFDRRIIVPGAFSATVVVSNTEIANEVRKVVPGKTIVHVYRNSDIWGTYIIWSARIRSENGATSVEFSGSTLESWFYRRIIDVDVLDYTQVDQIDIMRDMVANAQIGWLPYAAAANLHITMTPGVSGVKRDRRYLKTEAASYGQRLEELANVDNGFEYMLRTYIDADGKRVREIVWGYPKLNESINTFNYFYPGNITSYELTYDATEASTAFWARGDTIEEDYAEDAEPLMTPYPVLSDEYFQAAWPHLDRVIDYSSVTEIKTLEQYAQYWAATRAGVIMIPQIEVIPGDVDFSPNMLGSYATFTITDPFFPLTKRGEPTYSGQFRIVGLEVTPGERGTNESYRFVIEDEFDPTDAGGL
jgi:hypothetical protein